MLASFEEDLTMYLQAYLSKQSEKTVKWIKNALSLERTDDSHTYRRLPHVFIHRSVPLTAPLYCRPPAYQ